VAFQEKNMISLNEFLASAQSGEFNFGSNIHGTFDADAPDSPVVMTSHNIEQFTYQSLEDAYNHYVRDEVTTYQYAMHMDCPEFESTMQRLLPERESEDSQVWSAPVEVTCSYSQRQTPVHFKNEVLTP
jgi:hypothetical protein